MLFMPLPSTPHPLESLIDGCICMSWLNCLRSFSCWRPIPALVSCPYIHVVPLRSIVFALVDTYSLSLLSRQLSTTRLWTCLSLFSVYVLCVSRSLALPFYRVTKYCLSFMSIEFSFPPSALSISLTRCSCRTVVYERNEMDLE